MVMAFQMARTPGPMIPQLAALQLASPLPPTGLRFHDFAPHLHASRALQCCAVYRLIIFRPSRGGVDRCGFIAGDCSRERDRPVREYLYDRGVLCFSIF